MFWAALLFVGQLWLGEITRKRPKRVSWEEFLESNEPSEIRPIPYAGGTIEITPSRIWYGDFKQRAVERDSHWTDYIWAGSLAFLLDTITVAYRYYIGEAFAICYGPDRHAQRITIEDRPVYAAGLEFDNAGSGFLIDDPQAWGGDQPPGEGGQYSHCVLTRGNYVDAANVYLQQMLASGANKVPSLRGITSLISYGPSNTGVPESGYFAAGGVGYTPRLKEWKVVVRGQPDNLATGFNKIGRHMNPMEVIYEWSTSMEYGARVPDVELNLNNWRTCAETLFNEDNGWSGKIEGQTSPGEVVRDVLAQIDAVPDFSPSLGMGFRLIRRDYSFGSLRVLDKSVITRVDEFTPGTYEDTVNKVQVEFPEDQDNNFKPRKALYIDPANQQIQGGRVVPQTVGYLGVADFEQANVISTRLGRAQSLPRAPLECSVFPSWGRLTYVGEVVLFEWASPSLSIVMRVLKITPNGPDDQDYRLVLMEDQFSTGLRTFGEPAGERHDDPAAGLATAPPPATWNEAEFPPDGLIFTLQTANTNEFLATITGGIIFGTYAPGGQYARIWVTEPGGVQTLSPLRLAPDTNNEATFTWPALAAGVYEFCVQTFSLRDATNGVKVCADIAIAEIGSPSPSPSASVSPSASISRSPSPSASVSPSSSTSPSVSPTPSSSISPSASISPSSSASPSAAPSGHEVLFMANGEIESGEGQIFTSVGNNTAPDAGVTGAHGLVYDQAAVGKSIAFTATQTFSHHVRFYFRVDSDNRTFFSVTDGATTHLTLTWRTGGIVEVRRSATVLGTTSSVPMSIDTWYEINFYGLIDDSAGEWTLEIDGVIPNRSEGGTMQQTGVDTRNGGAVAQTSSASYGEPNLDTYMDDVVISAVNASLGLGQVETLMPNADGFYTALTPNTGTDHFNCVNEKPQDAETTYVTSSGAAQRDSYAFENRSVSGQIVAVALFWRGRLVSGTPAVTPFFRIGGVDFDGSSQTLTSSAFDYYWEVFDNNPATGFEWEDSELDAAEAGPLCSAANARITQFAMQVYVRTS